MKNISILLSIVLLQWSVAESTLQQSIKKDNLCKSALSKDYRLASTRELQCKTLYTLATNVKQHPFYRDFERIKLLKKIEEELMFMSNVQNIADTLENKEIKKNIKQLQSLVWPKGELCYFDIEIDKKQLSFISASYEEKTIKFTTTTKTFNSQQRGKAVEICTENNLCTPIDSNTITINDLPYTKLKIITPNGTLFYTFHQSINKTDLALLAYEIYSILYNQDLPPLREVKVTIEKSP